MANGTRHCRECGTAYSATRDAHIYCSVKCRKSANNRRMTRGAVLYDLFMGVRYQRATNAGDLALMSTVARVWYEEDAVILDGRKTWIANGANGRDILTEVSLASDAALREFHRRISAHMDASAPELVAEMRARGDI